MNRWEAEEEQHAKKNQSASKTKKNKKGEKETKNFGDTAVFCEVSPSTNDGSYDYDDYSS